MNDSEWHACGEPDLMLEELEGKVPHATLVEFVRRCWERVKGHLPVQSDITVVEQFASLAERQSDHDAVLYAAEAALKAAGWSPLGIKQEQRQQAAILRQLVSRRP